MKEHGGVHPAIVVDNVDPANSGRVKVRLPQVLVAGDSAHEAWARIATLMAGANRGTWFIPDVGDEVVVAFEQGNLDRPYVIGSLVNAGVVTVSAAISRFSGVVQCDTLISNSVVSQSYIPGAGNIW